VIGVAVSWYPGGQDDQVRGVGGLSVKVVKKTVLGNQVAGKFCRLATHGI
jgi:hypothetical protein